MTVTRVETKTLTVTDCTSQSTSLITKSDKEVTDLSSLYSTLLEGENSNPVSPNDTLSPLSLMTGSGTIADSISDKTFVQSPTSVRQGSPSITSASDTHRLSKAVDLLSIATEASQIYISSEDTNLIETVRNTANIVPNEIISTVGSSRGFTAEVDCENTSQAGDFYTGIETTGENSHETATNILSSAVSERTTESTMQSSSEGTSISEITIAISSETVISLTDQSPVDNITISNETSDVTTVISIEATGKSSIVNNTSNDTISSTIMEQSIETISRSSTSNMGTTELNSEIVTGNTSQNSTDSLLTSLTASSTATDSENKITTVDNSGSTQFTGVTISESSSQISVESISSTEIGTESTSESFKSTAEATSETDTNIIESTDEISTVSMTSTSQILISSSIATTARKDGTTLVKSSSITESIPSTSTIEPEPSCAQGGVCGAFSSCQPSREGCSCYTSAESESVCAGRIFCADVTSCTNSSDCDADEFCALETCCSPQNICIPRKCDNPSFRFIKLARRSIMREWVGTSTGRALI